MIARYKTDLPAEASVVLDKWYPSADWIHGWVIEETCYCVLIHNDTLHCVRIFPIGKRWEISVDNTVTGLHKDYL